MEWTDLDTFASFAEMERSEAKSFQPSPRLIRGEDGGGEDGGGEDGGGEDGGGEDGGEKMAGEKMAGNVKCIRRHVAALPLLAGTALGAKNGDVGGLGRLPAIEGFWWAVMLAGNRG